MCPNETMVLVTVVPMFAPMIIGTALAIGKASPGAATSPTMSAVDTEELCTMVVARMPTISPMNGFSVAAKKLSSNPPPSDLKPSPKPFTPTRKTKRRTRIAMTLRIGEIGAGRAGRGTRVDAGVNWCRPCGAPNRRDGFALGKG